MAFPPPSDRTRHPLPPIAMTPPVPRVKQFVKEGRIVCPVGHHIPNTVRIPEHGFIRCAHVLNRDDRVPASQRPGRVQECGLWTYIVVIRGRVLLVAVDLAELTVLEAMQTPGEILDYLGVFNPRG